MAGNSRILPIPHSHLGTHILRAKERGIQKLLHDIAHESKNKGFVKKVRSSKSTLKMCIKHERVRRLYLKI